MNASSYSGFSATNDLDNRTRIVLDGIGLRFIAYGQKKAGLKEAAFNRLFRRPVSRIRKTETFWALRRIDLNIIQGERIGIIGPNGAGKSTLLKLISGIYPPTEGSIEVAGRIAPLIELGAGFSPELSGRENIFLNGALLGLGEKIMNEKVGRILEFAELHKFAEMPLKYYSIGMKLRLAFSIATDIMPQILLIDEMFAGGDAFFAKKAKQRMLQLLDSSKIVIIVSHNLNLIQEVCGKVIWIQEGRIISEGDPKTVCEQYLAQNKPASQDGTALSRRLTT